MNITINFSEGQGGGGDGDGINLANAGTKATVRTAKRRKRTYSRKQLRKERQDAYQNGWDEGYREGYGRGHADGTTDAATGRETTDPVELPRPRRRASRHNPGPVESHMALHDYQEQVEEILSAHMPSTVRAVLSDTDKLIDAFGAIEQRISAAGGLRVLLTRSIERELRLRHAVGYTANLRAIIRMIELAPSMPPAQPWDAPNPPCGPSPFTSDGNHPPAKHTHTMADYALEKWKQAREWEAGNMPTMPTMPAMPTPESVAESRAKFTQWPPPANEVQGGTVKGSGVTLRKLMQLFYVTMLKLDRGASEHRVQQLWEDVQRLHVLKSLHDDDFPARHAFAFLAHLHAMRAKLVQQMGEGNVHFCLLDLDADGFYALVRTVSNGIYTHYGSYVDIANQMKGLPEWADGELATVAAERVYRKDCAAYERDWRVEQARLADMAKVLTMEPQDDVAAALEMEDLMAQRAQELAAKGEHMVSAPLDQADLCRDGDTAVRGVEDAQDLEPKPKRHVKPNPR